jgi:hypothetical protein
VANRKERRRASIDRDYKGDYLDFTYNQLVSGLLQVAGPKEKVLFADKSRVGVLKGKKSLLGRIFSKEGDPLESRFLLLSDKALYSFMFELEVPEGSPAGTKPLPNARAKAKLFWRVAMKDITSINVSPFADNFMLFRFSDGNTRDQLVTCRRKTEFLGVLVTAAKAVGKTVSITFNMTENICVEPKKQKFVEIKWVKDELIPAGKEKMIMVKHNVEIHVPSGVPATSVKEPFRPASFDPNSVQRPSLKALFDCGGNGVDELAFRTGDIMFVVKDAADSWYEAELNGKKGFVPESYVERIKVKKAAGGTTSTKFGGAAGGVRTPATKKKASPWKPVQADDGSTYYYNEDTNETSWDPPAEEPEPVAAPVETKRPAASQAAAGKGCTFPGCNNNKFAGKPCMYHCSLSFFLSCRPYHYTYIALLCMFCDDTTSLCDPCEWCGW